MTPYDILLLLQRNKPSVQQRPGLSPEITVASEQVGIVGMSLEHAKVLTMLLKRKLHDYEQSTGTKIPVEPTVAQKLGISREEDW
jgi:hypothetical protein